MRLSSVLLVLLPTTAVAQGIRDWQVHGMATLADARLYGGGLGMGYRPPGRIGFALSVTLGDLEGRLAGRGEALVVARLSPGRRTGVTPYGTVGVAGLFSRGIRRGYLVVAAGIESRPAAKAGWFVEGGLGGGVRLVGGVRVRRTGSSVRR